MKIPRSGSRPGCGYAKILARIAPDSYHGFSYVGEFLRPGAIVPESRLWPSPEFPETPVLIEYAGIDKPGWGKQRPSTQLYILWRYDLSSRKWTEVARTSAVGWQWAVDLGPIALRTLREARGDRGAEVLPNLDRVGKRIERYLDRELGRLQPPDQLQVLGILHDQLACRTVWTRESPAGGGGFGVLFEAALLAGSTTTS